MNQTAAGSAGAVMFVREPMLANSGFRTSMDISRDEQRVLHALAQGGHIAAIKNERGKIVGFELINRDGWLMSGLTPVLFSKLKAKKAIKSQGGMPYRITRRGLDLVRSQLDNR